MLRNNLRLYFELLLLFYRDENDCSNTIIYTERTSSKNCRSQALRLSVCLSVSQSYSLIITAEYVVRLSPDLHNIWREGSLWKSQITYEKINFQFHFDFKKVSVSLKTSTVV